MICAYSANTTDFSNNGLGPLDPIECTVSETLNGMWELTLTHARDDRGKCARLQLGNIIKAPVPAGFTPQLSIGDPEEAREIWAVNISERVALRAGPAQTERLLHAYKTGTEVVVLDKPAGDYWEVVTPDGRHGWMWHSFLAYVKTESGASAQAEIREAKALREQPFRIYKIEPDIDRVTVSARHIFYDLAENLLGACAPENATGAEAARAILSACRGAHGFTMYSDLTDEGSGSYTDKSPTEAIYGDGGLCDIWGAEIARDWWDVYAVARVGRDTDVVIRQGKNLKGLRGDIDISNAATRILPVGTDKDGEALYLPGDTPWIDSESIGQYPVIKWRLLQVQEAKVGRGMSRDEALDAMRAAAQKALDEGCDATACTLDVDFVNLGDTDEYRSLRLLYDVAMGDSVRVIAPSAGIDLRMRVTDYTYDCLAKRYKTMSLGTVADTMATAGISARQIANASLSGAKLIRGSVGVEQLQDLSVSTAKIALASIDYAHIKGAAIEQLAANSITAITARIQELIAGQITTDDLYAALATIAVAEITTANIQTANIDWAQITNLTAKIAEIGRAQITTANITNANIDWADIESLAAEIARIADARIGDATILTAQIADLQAEIATVITLAAQQGRFDFAKVKDLVASAMILEEGVAGTVYIRNLVATHANFVGAIIGDLVLQGEDGLYYDVSIQADGMIHTQRREVSDAELIQGITTDGKAIVATTANIADLNAETVRADSALIGSILTQALVAGKVTASEAFLASATVPELYATAIRAVGDSLDLSANESIRLIVRDAIDIGATNLIRINDPAHPVQIQNGAIVEDASDEPFRRSLHEYQVANQASNHVAFTSPFRVHGTQDLPERYTLSFWAWAASNAYENLIETFEVNLSDMNLYGTKESAYVGPAFSLAEDTSLIATYPADYVGPVYDMDGGEISVDLGSVLRCVLVDGNGAEHDVCTGGVGLPGSPERTERTFTVDFAGDVYLKIYSSNLAWSLSDVKLERGSVATDWSANQYDLEAYTDAQIRITQDAIDLLTRRIYSEGGTVETLQGSISTLAGQVALKAAQSTVNELSGVVSQHTTALSLVPGQITAAVEAIDEFHAGTTVEITEDRFRVETDLFDVDINSGGESFTLDAGGGTMNNLTVNRQVIAPNVAYRYAGGNISIGANETYTSLNSYLQANVNNRTIGYDFTITLTSDIYEDITIGGMSGIGQITINGQGQYKIVGTVTIRNAGIYLRFSQATVEGTMNISDIGFIKLQNSTVNSPGLCLSVFRGASVELDTCTLVNTPPNQSTPRAWSLIYMEAGATLTANNVRGGYASQHFISALNSVITWRGTRPLGTTDIAACLTMPADLSTLTPADASGYTPPTVITTAHFACAASKTAYGTSSWFGGNDQTIRQGYAALTGGNHELYGCFWFDLSSLSGKTIRSAVLTLTRASGKGRASEISVQLYRTGLESASGNPNSDCARIGILGTIANGETKQFAIPDPGTAITAAMRKANSGFMLRIDDGALLSGRGYSANYAHFDGCGETNPPTLTVTYQ